jgi:hypothetical protein
MSEWGRNSPHFNFTDCATQNVGLNHEWYGARPGCQPSSLFPLTAGAFLCYYIAMATIIRLFSRKARARHRYVLAVLATCQEHWALDSEHWTV